MNTNQLENILAFVKRLEQSKIHYDLASNQEDAITIEVTVPGERWEIDFYCNGVVDVEIFRSDGKIRDQNATDELFSRFSDD